MPTDDIDRLVFATHYWIVPFTQMSFPSMILGGL
ncbi:MAG: hypothetical protein QOF70_3350 [Acetobacteraceae bacterium]|jgi:hypothetical protein|nr:hypothetical protein [Acetobacteraceae bacterium]